MAYNVSENYRERVYSGGAVYDCKLYFDNSLISPEQISSIKISSPIIDTSSETGKMFHIGTFASQKLTIKFRNLDGLNLTQNPDIRLEIGLEINGQYEYIPIGKYLIDELGENYQQTCEITCMDYAIKFKSNLDISQFFDTDNKILASDLFEAICTYYGVNIGTYPSINNDKEIYFYDNTLTGKQYISYLAELFGGNAKIERDGSCSIIPLKNYTDIEIDALTSKKFEVGDTYVLTRVCYDNGFLKFQAGGNVISVDELPEEGIDVNAYYYLLSDMKYYKYINISEDEEEEVFEWQETNDIKNTLYLRTDNPFISDQVAIDNIYAAVKDFSITNITCENRMDFSVDSWDIVKYVLNNGEEYYTLYDNTINFNGVAMGTVKVDVPLKTVEETTNIIQSSDEARIYRLKTELNEQKNTLTTTISEVNANTNEIIGLQNTANDINQSMSNLETSVSSRITQIEQSIAGLSTRMIEFGGNNIFYYAKEFWTDGTQNDNNEANLDEYTDTELQSLSVSKAGYVINSGTSQQKNNLRNDVYTISFTYKKLIELAECYVLINGTRYDLDSLDWEEKIITLNVDSGIIDFSFYSDTDNALKVFDLMGNVGDEKQIWTQNPNETRTDTVVIGKGIQVNSSTTNTYTRIDADGNRTFNRTTNQVVSEQTDKGTWTQQITANKGSIGGILIQEQDGQTWISSLL